MWTRLGVALNATKQIAKSSCGADALARAGLVNDEDLVEYATVLGDGLSPASAPLYSNFSSQLGKHLDVHR